MKTIKRRRHLNDMIVEGMSPSDFYSALYLEDLDHIHVHDNVINESVLRDGIVQELFDYVTQNKRTLMTVKEVMDMIPIGTKWHRILRKSKSHEHRLYVDICDFSGTNFYEELKYFSKDTIPNDILIQKSYELNRKFDRFTDGGFVTFDNHREFGIIFLNAKKGKTLFTFKHEMIHYFDWVKGAFKTSESGDETYYREEIDAIHKYVNSNFYVPYFTYITSADEYMNLLNNFLDLLKLTKAKYFNDMDPHEFARMIVNTLKLEESMSSEIIHETPAEYCKRIMSYKFFKELKGQSSFIMILFFMMIKEKVTNIRNHIFGLFS